MAGMLRYPDEQKFQEMLAKSHAKVHQPRIVRPLDGPGTRVATPAEKMPRKAPVKAVVKPAKPPSEIEQQFAAQIAEAGLPSPAREYPFLRGRAHRLDFAWPDHRINGMQVGVEVQGMVHRVKGRFSADIEKRALGLLQNWMILEVGGEQIRNGKAIEWLKELFAKATKGSGK